jgi:5'(3')-deoxyribonucleotidase
MWIDVDEVLADFQGPVFEAAKRLFGKDVSPQSFDGTVWDLFTIFTNEETKVLLAECEKPGWCAGLKPLPGAQHAVGELRKHVKLFAVTSHFHSMTWVYERDRWLMEHFNFAKSEIVHTAAKYLISADICLDDKPDHVLAWQAEHPDGLAMLWPIANVRNMPMDKWRVKDWPDVIDRVIHFQRKASAIELLDEAEWDSWSYSHEGNYCRVCSAEESGAKIPKHKPDCRLHEILKNYRSRA